MIQDLRIIWAITTKDILDALKNKNALTNLIMVLLMIVFYRYFQSWMRGDELPAVLVYEANESVLVETLSNSNLIRLASYSSRDEMLSRLSSGDLPELGLSLPDNVDQALALESEVILDGYVLNWVTQSEVEQLQLLIEQEISSLTGSVATIGVDISRVYSQRDSGGRAFLASVSAAFTLLFIGIGVAPHLMIDEKQDRTLDTLLVSPAGSAHVVAAKALTGLLYCLLSVGVVLFLHHRVIVHWGLALIAITVEAIFCVAIGLLLGSIVNARQHLGLWGSGVISLLLLPMFIAVLDKLLSPEVSRVLYWMPMVAWGRMMRVSFMEQVTLADFGPEMGLTIFCAAVTLSVVVWLVYRSDRMA